MTTISLGTGANQPTAPQTAAGVRSTSGKRLFDIVIGSLLLLLATPLLVALAVVVIVTSDGPAFYRQMRIGLNGTPFVIRKLRTMTPTADTTLEALRHLNEITDGPLFKISDDPRMTPFGRWLRRFSLDELPQLVNVVTGSMSLVGPRPALPDEVARYSPREARRLLVKPGLTGLWQVNGRSDLPWHEGVALDLHYVQRGSILMDVTILVRTIPAVVLARGAY